MIFNSITKSARIFHMMVLAIPLLASSCSNLQEPTRKTVLEAPAADLAEAYLFVKTSLPLVSAGARATIHIQGATINKDNVEEYKAKYEKRLALYEEAIKQRGFKTISGEYKGEATESCARSNSILAILHKQQQSGIEITQDGIDAQFVIKFKQDDKEMSIKNPAAIAESAVSVLDAMNSDYFFRGVVKDNVIVFKPNLAVLDTWPKWASPPSRSDLENCTITLERF